MCGPLNLSSRPLASLLKRSVARLIVEGFLVLIPSVIKMYICNDQFHSILHCSFYKFNVSLCLPVALVLV